MSNMYDGEGAFRTVVTEFLVFSRIARRLGFAAGVGWYRNWEYIPQLIQFKNFKLDTRSTIILSCLRRE